MSVLLQVSDAHFGTEQAPVVDALVALARAQRPDVVLWTGDITQRARARQFAAARAVAAQLVAAEMGAQTGARTLALPGNHDIPLFDIARRVLMPYARYREAFGPLEPVWSNGDLLIACVNTTRWWRHTHGEVSSAQIDRVASELRAAAPGQLRVVAVHQPIAVVRERDRRHRLRGAQTALTAWARAGADVILGGHIHLPYVLRFGQGAHQVLIAQAGTAVSHRIREGVPNSVNLLRTNGERAGVLERWDYVRATGFVRVVQVPVGRVAPG